MNKKVLYLSALAAVSFGMTSCIDNEEPDGLKDLRQGQAEKLRAEGEVSKAQASKLKAEEALIAAQAAALDVANQLAAVKVEEEKVVLASMKVDLTIKELSIALAEAQNAADIEAIKIQLATQQAELAKAQAALATENAKLDAAKLNAEKIVLEAEVALAQAKADQAEAAKSIELQVALLKDPSQYYEISNARQNVVSKTTSFEAASVSLVEAQKKLVTLSETLKKDSISQLNLKVQAVENKENAVEMAEFDVEIAELGVKAAENAKKEFQEISQKDMQTWAAELAKVQEEYKALKDQLDAIDLELTTLSEANAVEMKPLQIAYNDATTALNNASTELYKPLNDYSGIANYYSFDITEALAEEYFEDYSVTGFTYNPDNGKLISQNTINNSNLSYVLKNYVLSLIDGYIITPNAVAQEKIKIAELKAQLADLKATSDADVKAWKEALAAYEKAAVAYKWAKDNETSPIYTEISALAGTYYSTYLQEADAKNVAAKLANYLKLRKEFDGFENETLEGYVNNYKDENFTALRNYLWNYGTSAIGSSSRNNNGGSWGEFRKASYKAFGGYDVYAEFTEEQLEELIDNGYISYYGTWGQYQYAKSKIDKRETTLANQADWVALREVVAAVVDANDAEFDKLNKEIDKTVLNPYVAKVREAQEAIDALEKEQNEALRVKQNERDLVQVKVNEAFAVRDALAGLVNAADVDNKVDNVYSTDKQAAIDLAIEKALVNLDKNIATAKQNVETKEQAVETAEADLATAKAELKMFKEGTLTASVQIENQVKAIKVAQATYDKAKVEYEEAIATLNALLEALKA